jgi:hypothetical protein
MTTITVSPKFQVVIQRDLCRLLNIQPGQKLRARVQGGHIERIPEQSTPAARGFLSGIDIRVERENDRARPPRSV